MDLRPHLRLHSGFCSSFRNDAAFVNIASEWLFAVDVLSGLERWQCGKRVGVLGCGDKNGINVVHFLKEIAKVFVAARFGGLIQSSAEIVFVYVDHRNDWLAEIESRFYVGSTAATNPDQTKIHF
jgi:hypothetical protein